MTQTQDSVAALSLTAEAAEKARQFLADENLPVERAGLRVSVLPGGCSGFQYGLGVEEEAREDDEIIESEGIRLFVDPFSMQYVKGTQIGYQSTFQGSGFTFSNPNAAGSCGCGTSFNV